jgi:alpha/beta superfamily hydrolase
MAKREERAVAIPLLGDEGAAGEVLEGLFIAGEGAAGAVIAPPHPLYGGSMDSPVVSELAWACAKAGLASLRFNWRGVGASSGVASGDARAAGADYAAALAQLARSIPGRVVAAGYSFGAAAAARAAAGQPRVDRLVLVAPPPQLLDVGALREEGREVLLLTGAHDAIAPSAALAALVEALAGARLVTIDEADHFFGAGLAELGAEVAAWLKER